ncbi:uncharacterized protein LOC120329982 [Styela clava]
MNGIIISLLIVVISKGAYSANIGSCQGDAYRVDISYCKTEFVKQMNGSSNAFGDCPSFYAAAHACFNSTLTKCFPDGTEEHNATIAILKRDFGDENFFCVDGFLHSMKNAMLGMYPENCTDTNFNNYTKCEIQFRTTFREEFESGSKDLNKVSTKFSEADLCQRETATSCRVPISYYEFYEYDFNPFDPEVIQRIADAENKIIQGEDFRQNDTTLITVVVVALILLLILCVIFFFLWRRDKSRAEIRRRKSMERRKKPGNTEPPAGDNEMVPLHSGSAVQTTSDQVSSA